MSGTATNWYDPNMFAPGGGGNPDTNQGNVGYGSVDTAGKFLGAIGGGLTSVMGGPLALLNLGAAAATGQAPSTMNTVNAAKGFLSQALGLSGGKSSRDQEVTSSLSDAMSGGMGPGTNGRDTVGTQERAEDPVGRGGYADGGPVGMLQPEGASVAPGALTGFLDAGATMGNPAPADQGAAVPTMAHGGAVDGNDDDMRRVAHGALFHATMLQHHMNQLRDRHPGALQRVLAHGGLV